MCVYICIIYIDVTIGGDPKEYIRLYKLVKEFSKLAGGKINIKINCISIYQK